MTTDFEARIAALPPEKRKLLERRLAQEGLAAGRRPGGERSGRTIPRRADGPGPWPLSYGQRRLWFIDRLNPGTPAYNIPFAGRMAGPLRTDRLARSLAEVIRRHQVLRSRFVEHDGRPAQVIDPPPPPRLPLVDLSGLPEVARHAEADRLTDADPQVPFDLARGPVVRMTLLRLEATLHDLLVTMPHIVTDAWSMAILFRELPALYDADRHGRPSPLPDPPVQVADFALWERERLDGAGEREGTLAAELDFWREHLAGAPTVLELPTDRPRPPVQTMRGVRRAVAVPAETTRRLEALADREGATPFMALLASFAAALSRWTGQDDLLLASPLATRSAPEVQGLIGFFIDNAVLRADLRPGRGGDPSYRELLGRVKESALATFAHQGVPFEKVAEAVGAGGDLSRPPLAQVNFVLQNVHIPAPEFEELSLVRAQQTDTRSSRFDLALGLFETDGALAGWFEYATDLFDETTIARLERDWLDLLDAALERPDAPLSALPRLAPAARQQMLVEWNDRPGVGGPTRWSTAFDPWDATVDELVAGWAARSPDAVALEEVADGSGRARAVSYGELDRRASALAERLSAALGPRAAGGGEPRVALALGRSPELVVATLAVWRIGGCYVPIDPAYPEERRAFLRDDARPVAVIRPGSAGDLEIEALDGETRGPGAAAPIRATARGGRLAYVLYTSGSTGRPKGVAVPHRAVVRLARGGGFEGLGAGRGRSAAPVVLALTPASFDASVFALWVPLASGARVALYPEGPPAVDALAEALRRVRATAAALPTGLFHLLAEARPEAFAGVRDVWAGGEALSPALARRVAGAPTTQGAGTVVHNSYGPTENGVYTTVHALDPAAGRATVPLGRPVAGTRVMVVDRELQPVPLGAAGELVTGGAGLARGYYRRPAATAERFVPDPFGTAPGGRLYRTGDLARWLPDGTLDFLGRADRQVKVRGFRVEPGEVEAALLAHPEVSAAAAVLRDGRLVAYVVGRNGAGGDPGALRSFLAGRLPDFMVPSAFVPLDALPLTPRGKLDRAALPDPRKTLLAGASEGGAPADRVEEVLLAVWREVLGVERLGVHDRFFDLGGDSILAIRAIARAAEEGIELEPRQLFEHPTVAALAEVTRSRGGARAAERGPVTGPVPLGPAQCWFLERLAPPVPEHWNLAVLLEPADGPSPLRFDRLAAALGRVLEGHDMLRARFLRDRDGWRQEVAPPGRADAARGGGRTAVVDLTALPAERAPAAQEAAAAQCQGSLDLATGGGGLVRLVRFDLPGPSGGPDAARLLLVAHHLVTDAVSLQAILADLGRGLADERSGAAPPPRSASYREWVEALREWLASPAAEAERARVRELAAAGGPERPPSREGDAAHVEERLPAPETALLLAEARERLRASPEEVLLAGVAEALASGIGPAPGNRAGSAPRLRVDVEGHGRALPEGCASLDLTRTVGWFTAVRPVAIDRVRPDGGPGASPARWLRKVKDELRAVADGGVGHAAARWLDAGAPALPEADLSFNYLGRLAGVDAPEGAPFRLLAGAEAATGPLRHPAAPRPAALELTAWIAGGELHALWTYDPALRRREEMEALAARALATVRLLLGGGAEAPGASEAITPSDFPHAGLDQGSLDRLLGKLGDG